MWHPLAQIPSLEMPGVTCCPTTDPVDATLALNRSHRARIELVVDETATIPMQVDSLGEAIGSDEHIGSKRAVEHVKQDVGLMVYVDENRRIALSPVDRGPIDQRAMTRDGTRPPPGTPSIVFAASAASRTREQKMSSEWSPTDRRPPWRYQERRSSLSLAYCRAAARLPLHLRATVYATIWIAGHAPSETEPTSRMRSGLDIPWAPP
jgi:hypothetical protein